MPLRNSVSGAWYRIGSWTNWREICRKELQSVGWLYGLCTPGVLLWKVEKNY